MDRRGAPARLKGVDEWNGVLLEYLTLNIGMKMGLVTCGSITPSKGNIALSIA